MRFGQPTVIYESSIIRVGRSVRDADKLPVVVKSLSASPQLNVHRQRIKYEYDILCHLAAHNVPHVLVPVELYDEGGELALVTRDVGASSLRTLMPLTLQEVLHVGLRVAEALEHVHRQGVTHKDINPDNVVLNRSTGAVQLIDFGIAARLSREAQPLASPSAIEGTVAYVSPEQTGRMTRMLDHRSDFYSLGVMLYELLCHTKPFVHSDLAQLVHAHLAQLPRHPCEVVPRLPRALGDLVMKLLEKAVEDRYQSASGLAYDLRHMAAAVDEGRTLDGFALGSQDFSEQFKVPDKIYGREREVAAVAQVYAGVAQGTSALLMIHGPSGIGKSALVHCLQASLTERNGLFAAGKHDLLRRHVPLSALATAIDQVVRRVLLEPPNRFAVWQRRAQEALGSVGQTLVGLAPALELLVGAQPQAPVLGPQEAENRMFFLLTRLLRAFCVDQPLVLFLDDLQWADAATLKFLSRWHNDAHCNAGLLLVGAYRSEEVGAAHPLRLVLDDWRDRGIACTALALSPMGPSDIAALVRDATGNDHADDLAALVFGKTAGNAFFVRELMRDLARAAQIRYDRTLHHWTWDVERIRQAAVTSNVVEFMTAKIGDLPNAEQKRVLAIAACIGSRFGFSTLTDVADMTPAAVHNALYAVLEAGFVQPHGPGWRYGRDGDARYAFVHDKVHEAALRLLDADALARTHQRIGLHLLKHVDDEQGVEVLFSAVNHLNQARHLLSDAERVALAEHNVRAAQESLRATAFDIAADYWRNALLQWRDNTPEARCAALQLARCEYLLGQRDVAEQRLDALMVSAADTTDKVDIIAMRAKCLAGTMRYKESAWAALEALAMLQVKLPRTPNMGHVVWAMVKMQRQLKGRPVENLADVGTMHDPRILRVMELLNDMAAPTYFFDTNLYAVLVLTMGQLTLTHGNSRYSAFVFGSLTAMYSVMGNFALAARYAQVARVCIDRLDGAYTSGKLAVEVSLGFAGMHARDCAKMYAQAGMRGLAAGDLLNATNSIGMAFNTLLLVSGEDAVGEVESVASLTTQLNKDFWRYSRYQQDAVASLTGDCLRECDELNEDDELRRIQAGQVEGIAPIAFFMHRTTVNCVHHRMQIAAESGAEAIRRGAFLRMGPHNAFVVGFFFAIAATQLAHERGGKTKYGKLLKQISKTMRKLAAVEPFVALGVSKLIDAEMGRGVTEPLARMYEEATQLLDITGYTAFGALGHECAARYYLRGGHHGAAQSHLRAALSLYTAWGAKTKVAALRQEWELLAPERGQVGLHVCAPPPM